MDNECNKPQREPEVVRQMNQLEKTIAILGESIATLRTRFEPVLRVQPTITAGEPPKNKEDLVPLAITIRQLCARLQEYNGAIREMIETCEL
uniref:Uncharacterized protein n=1 Tax=viral metagenome TaxID=1070528 RepID=A0A6H2A276_9ZZZZ